jgi:hypothetical protein
MSTPSVRRAVRQQLPAVNNPFAGSRVSSRAVSRHSAEGRQIVRSDRALIANARELTNEATLIDYSNELTHQIKLNDIQRRARRAHDIIHAQSAILDVAEVLAKGNPGRQMEYLEVYNAWKMGELYRLATDND